MLILREFAPMQSSLKGSWSLSEREPICVPTTEKVKCFNSSQGVKEQWSPCTSQARIRQGSESSQHAYVYHLTTDFSTNQILRLILQGPPGTTGAANLFRQEKHQKRVTVAVDFSSEMCSTRTIYICTDAFGCFKDNDSRIRL